MKKFNRTTLWSLAAGFVLGVFAIYYLIQLGKPGTVNDTKDIIGAILSSLTSVVAFLKAAKDMLETKPDAAPVPKVEIERVGSFNQSTSGEITNSKIMQNINLNQPATHRKPPAKGTRGKKAAPKKMASKKSAG